MMKVIVVKLSAAMPAEKQVQSPLEENVKEGE